MTPAAGASAAERVGEVLAGKYRVVRLLGEGGMGRVYEAEHVTVGRRFAVKLLRRQLAANAEALARFKREARAAGALENEHIAAVLDFDTAADGEPFLVMEYLEGKSLGQLLADEGPLPVPRAVSVVLQVCRGLDAAHSAGIVHRDLKPDNLFVTRRADGSEHLKILDFGIAKLLKASTESAPIDTGAAIGTPFYMAPEQARGDKTLDERVDIYALGVILYELLSGEKPHPGDCGNAVLAHVLTEPPVPLAKLRKGLPRALVELVHRALSFAPGDRPSSARELSRELEALLPPEARLKQSQFDLRPRAAASSPSDAAVRGTAPTLPTPDSHAVSVPGSARRPRSRRALFVVVALLAPLAGFALFRWFDEAMTEPDPAVLATSTTQGPLATAEAADVAMPERVAAPAASATQSSATPATTSSEPAAASPARPAVPSLGARGRPRGRPAPAPERPPAAADQGAALATEPRSAGISSAPDPAPRVRFDPRNPYD